MEHIITKDNLEKTAADTLLMGLDYIAENRQYSVWTKKNTGWQEKWERAQYSGLYATTNALRLLSRYPERYKKVIDDAVNELRYMFDKSIDYADCEQDSSDETMRKKRCRFLLEQNNNTTLKAVYYLRTYYELCGRGLIDAEDERFAGDVKLVMRQVEDAYDPDTGYFIPARDNHKDNSMLTTMQAYVVMKTYHGSDEDRYPASRKLFLHALSEYDAAKTDHEFKNRSKFERYILKRDAIAAVYALSHTTDSLTTEEKVLLRNVVFMTMSDPEIRNGFMINDSYAVPGSTMSYDVYSTDSKVIYAESVLQLINQGILPATVAEYFMDDCIEVIDTVREKKYYASWDLSLSFSHNIKGLLVLQTLLDVLKKNTFAAPILKINPNVISGTSRFVDLKGIVLFMAFGESYTESLYYSVDEVLQYLGFEVWCASNELYDRLVMDSIWSRLDRAQAVIIDCTGKRPNVMYEAGLSHGLGKHVLLCGPDDDAFPYENREHFHGCIYNADGNVNPPPYRDLQRGIIEFIEAHIHDFCMSSDMQADVLDRIKEFTKEYLE